MVRNIALALSGGGYRAAYYHLGVLRKLQELGLLQRIGVISSVSGGSIVAGAYATSLLNATDKSRLNDAEFESFVKKFTNFTEKRKLDVGAVLKWPPWRWPPWRSSASTLEHAFGKLFRKADGDTIRTKDLTELPVRFVINATAVHSGRGWRFISGGFVEEWELTLAPEAAYSRAIARYECDATLAMAVTASAAFPVFCAATIPLDEIKDMPKSRVGDSSTFHVELPRRIRLSDGGVRDNTGMLSILAGQWPGDFEKNHYLIASDAGAELAPPKLTPAGRVRKFHYLHRQVDISNYHSNRVIGTWVLQVMRGRPSPEGIALLKIEEFVPQRGEKFDDRELAYVPTRLKSPGPALRDRLMEHGSNMLWARVSQYTDLLVEEDLMPNTDKHCGKDVPSGEGAEVKA